jgi:GH24 family phage-related lysozyme (muramidase)
MASNVDFQFIKEQEGFKLNGYVPKDADGKILGESGVTIASGFDIGQRNEQDLLGLPEDIQTALKPYLGLTLEQADNKLKKEPLNLTKAQAEIINKFAKKEALRKLSKQWKEKTGTDFESLPQNQATPIASVAFQYGDLKTKTPKFWEQVTTGQWGEAKKELANFGDDYGSRRKRELDYLNRPAVKPQEEIVKETQEVVAPEKQSSLEYVPQFTGQETRVASLDNDMVYGGSANLYANQNLPNAPRNLERAELPPDQTITPLGS